MTDTTLSLALKEAYASAPDLVIYHTLEFRHPSFTEPIRVVRDFVPLTATLEASAPLNASEAVEFVAFSFDFIKPEVTSESLPQFTIEIDNVGREITANLEAALESNELIKVTYREFLEGDLSAPQNDPPLHFTIMSITATPLRISAVAGFPDLMNKRFPTTEYDGETYSGLAL